MSERKNKALIKVKDDINFLEYPNWTVSEENIRKITIEKEKGKYIVVVPDNIDRLPNRADKITLYTILHEMAKNNFETNEIITTRYKLAKYVYDKIPTTSQYKRLIKSLDRWFGVRIFFEGLFYDGKEYTSKRFGVIDNYEIEKESGKLKIKFNEEYINYIKDTQYYKYINLTEYKKLKRPVSVRLYELLVKSFKDRKIWKIDIMKLAEKLTLNIKYPAHVYAKIKPAINEINRNTELNIELEYDKDTKICTFKLKEKKTAQQQVEINQKQLRNLIEKIPQEHRTAGVIELVNSYLATHGSEYVFYNIAYTNNNAKSNYKAYLKKALENNYGREIQEKHHTKQEKERLRQLWNELVGKRFRCKDNNQKKENICRVEKDFHLFNENTKEVFEANKNYIKEWIEYIKKNLI